MVHSLGSLSSSELGQLLSLFFFLNDLDGSEEFCLGEGGCRM